MRYLTLSQARKLIAFTVTCLLITAFNLVYSKDDRSIHLALAQGQQPLSQNTATLSAQQQWQALCLTDDIKTLKDLWLSLTVTDLLKILDASINIQCKNQHGWSALHSAARFVADPMIVSLLMQHGADPKVVDQDGDSPLHWAAAENHNPEILSLLLEYHADINLQDDWGWTPLHSAVERSSNRSVIELLIVSGADVNKRAYYFLLSAEFLLKHNDRISESDKKDLLMLMKKSRSK